MRNLKDRVLNSLKGNKKDIKISVVVPTYNTELEGLKNLMASIDKQTMNSDEYELVFVDDDLQRIHTNVCKSLLKHVQI